MAKIRVKAGGVGVKYIDANGNERHALKLPEHGPFECDDAQAARLVKLGVAAYVGAQAAPVAQADDQQSEGQQSEGQQSDDAQQVDTGETSQEPEKEAHHLDAEQLEEMTNKQLIALAAELGADVSGCKKKADYIAAIVAVDVYTDDEDDELPELSAADPE